MTLTKRMLAVILSILMLVGMLPMTAMAATETGRLGDSNVYYELTDEGTLRLYGKGATPNYPAEPDASPFAGKYVEKVVVEQGVTSIGNYIFAECGDIEEVSLPKSLRSVGNVAFGGCHNLKEITFDLNTESFGFAALYNCRSLKSVTFKANSISCFSLYDAGANSLLYSVEDANIYITLPLTVKETLEDTTTNVNTYEDAAQLFNQNNNTVYCVNDNAKIKWKNDDGTVLETDENATQGEIPTYDGATPTKPADDTNAYYFTGWTPQPFAVMGDMSYTATYGSYGKTPYIDENGEEQEVFARPLTGTETLLSPGWYVVNKNINYSHTLYFTDEVHLILADGKKLTFSNGCDFSASDPTQTDLNPDGYDPMQTQLNFYWQSGKTGALTMNGQILTWHLNVYGGNITSKVFGYSSTFYDGNLTFKDEAQCMWLNVYGGNVKMESCDASGQFNIYGGNFYCTGTVTTYANAYVTLGYTKPSDSIYIGYLYLEGNKNNYVNQHVKIKDGQKMADAADRSTVFEGELPISSDLITVPDINGKTLVPYAHNTITYMSGEGGTVTGASEADYGDEITLTVTPDENYALDELTVKTADNKNIEVVDNKFIMPATAVTVSATFISTKRYTVKWVVDGEVVETDENLPFGATPEYNGATPQKAATPQYTYTFEGWSPAITPVASDVTYTAQFGITLNSYTVTWVVNGETVETDENVYYGMTPEYNGEALVDYSDEDRHYLFNGWSDGTQVYPANALPAVTAPVTYSAVYTVEAHGYGEQPEWIWADDDSAASAVFTCTVCGMRKTVEAQVSSVVGNLKTDYTATAAFNGKTYTDTKTATRAINLWLGGTGVNANNCNDILGDGSARYDEATNTLTLTDATIEIMQYKQSSEAFGIRYNGEKDIPFHIVLNGTNRIIDNTADSDVSAKYGYVCFASTPHYTISGNGSLDISMTAEAAGITYYGIQARKPLALDGTTVTVNILGTEATTGVDLWYNDTVLSLVNNASLSVATGGNAATYSLASNRNVQNLSVEDGSTLAVSSDNAAANSRIRLTDATKALGVGVNSVNSEDGIKTWDGETALSSYKLVKIPFKDGWVVEDGKIYYYKNEEKVTGVAQAVYPDATIGTYGPSEKDLIYHEEAYKAAGYETMSYFLFDENGEFQKDYTGYYEADGEMKWVANGEFSWHGCLVTDGTNYAYVSAGGALHKEGTYWIGDTNDLLEKGYYTFSEYKIVMYDGFTVLDGKLYYYENGRRDARKGLFEIDGKYYYAKSTQELVRDAAYFVSNTNGLLEAGTYRFDSDGRIIFEEEVKNGLIEENGQLVYYVDGVITHAGLIKIGEDYYYIKSNGCAVRDCRYYVSDTNGLMARAYREFDENGKMLVKNGLVEENGQLVYYKDGEKAHPGLIEIDGSYYYIKSNCTAVRNCRYYVSNTNGYVAKDTYTFDADGRLVMPEVKNGLVEENGKLFYFEDGVNKHPGLIEIDGAYYYICTSGFAIQNRDYYISNTNGILAKGTYHFDADGKLVMPH